jgi:signal transduction histidine kinase
VLSKIRAGEMVDHFETVRQRKDGSMLDVSLTVSPVRTGDGRIVGASKIARDISERKRLVEAQRHLAEHEQRTRRETLESENRRIREAARVKSEFVANVSHELRTPLQSIIGFTEVLIDERLGSVPEQYREVGGLVLASSQHLLQLINDILDLAKLESGNIEFEPEPVDLKSLVDEVYAIVSGLATHSGITVEREVDPRLSVAYADPAKLKQVFYNYLSNAIKFTAEGGRVSIRLSPEGNDAFRIEVEDTGIGVAVEAQDRLFVEFQQLDPGTSKRYQGTGLGLALTKRIVAAQGGSVGFRSRHGEGSTFFAILPLITSPKSADITSRADRAHLEREGR